MANQAKAGNLFCMTFQSANFFKIYQTQELIEIKINFSLEERVEEVEKRLKGGGEGKGGRRGEGLLCPVFSIYPTLPPTFPCFTLLSPFHSLPILFLFLCSLFPLFSTLLSLSTSSLPLSALSYPMSPLPLLALTCLSRLFS